MKIYQVWIEQKLKTVDELVDIQSYSRQNMSYIILEFPVEYSKDVAVKDVKNLIDEIKKQREYSSIPFFSLNKIKSRGIFQKVNSKKISYISR